MAFPVRSSVRRSMSLVMALTDARQLSTEVTGHGHRFDFNVDVEPFADDLSNRVVLIVKHITQARPGLIDVVGPMCHEPAAAASTPNRCIRICSV